MSPWLVVVPQIATPYLLESCPPDIAAPARTDSSHVPGPCLTLNLRLSTLALTVGQVRATTVGSCGTTTANSPFSWRYKVPAN